MTDFSKSNGVSQNGTPLLYFCVLEEIYKCIIMELYAKPIVTTEEDGTIHIDVRTITPDYIDTRLAELAVFKQINYNLEEVVSAVQNSPSTEETKKHLKTNLGIGSAEADFLLDLTFEEMAYYFQKENCETEIQRWKGLEELLSAQ